MSEAPRTPDANPQPQRVRKWTVYPGKSKFWCNGRLMMARDNGMFFLTLLLVIIIGGMFFALDCPYLTVRVSPAIPAVGAAMYILILGTLLRCAFTDPGVIPRATPDETKDIMDKYTQRNRDAESQNTYVTAPTWEIEIKGRAFKLTYCHTCKIFRPPRCSHCSRCDNCVERFDHHCPMVGNCVGKRNYRYFYLFVTSTAIMCLYVIGCNIATIVLRSMEHDFATALKTAPGSVIEAFVCFLSFFQTVALSCFHTVLIAQEVTTNEDIKGLFKKRKSKISFNPFSRGNIFKNCCAVLCAPRTPSLLDRRGFTYLNDDGEPMGYDNQAFVISNQSLGTVRNPQGQQPRSTRHSNSPTNRVGPNVSVDQKAQNNHSEVA